MPISCHWGRSPLRVPSIVALISRGNWKSPKMQSQSATMTRLISQPELSRTRFPRGSGQVSCPAGECWCSEFTPPLEAGHYKIFRAAFPCSRRVGIKQIYLANRVGHVGERSWLNLANNHGCPSLAFGRKFINTFPSRQPSSSSAELCVTVAQCLTLRLQTLDNNSLRRPTPLLQPLNPSLGVHVIFAVAISSMRMRHELLQESPNFGF